MRNYKTRNVLIIKQSEKTKEELQSLQEDLRLKRKEILISQISIVVNIIIAFLALGTFFYSMKQTDASIKSVGLADSVFRDTKKYNSVAIALQKENAESSAKENDRQFQLQSRSVEAQITTLKETQRRFEVENEPTLEIDDFAVNSISKKLDVSFFIYNKGKSTAEIFFDKGGIEGSDLSLLDLKLKNYIGNFKKGIWVKNTTYLSNLKPYKTGSNKEIKEDIKKTIIFTYSLIYKSVITSKRKRYDVIVAATVGNSNEWRILYNKNYYY